MDKKQVSKALYEAAKKTWENRKGKIGEVISPRQDFSGVRGIDVSNLPTGTILGGNVDGIGTKVEVSERLNDHRTSAFNLIGMVADDTITYGAEPIAVFSIFDTNTLRTLTRKQLEQLTEGYVNAAAEANVAVLNGETAELGKRVSGFGDFNYNWGATCIWIAKRERMFTGKETQEGDYLIAFGEDGFRSNGFTLLKKILTKNYGKKWHEHTWKKTKQNLAELALTPSRIYTPAVVAMFGGYSQEPKTEIHGVAHITGEGIPEKLGRVLKPSGLGALINNPFEPTEFMRHVQELGKVSDREAYEAWNMGQGMIIISPKPDEVVDIASNYGIEAKPIGKVIRARGISIKNKGAFSKPNEYLHFGLGKD